MELQEEIAEFIRDLVRVPSQGGADPLDAILGTLSSWLSAQGLSFEVLHDPARRPVGLLAALDSGQPGPAVCLDACIDTAPIGQRESWAHDPFGAVVLGGRLFGRGAADSKAAAAIFCHLLRDLQRAASLRRGTLHVLLDGDEHSGRFGGARAYVARVNGKVSFVAIGYPGPEKLIVGARGIFRATLKTFGDEIHSGATVAGRTRSALVKMAALVADLSGQPLPPEPDPDFPCGPGLTVTRIQGGSGFTQLPGVCEADVDVRLTPGFGPEAARLLLTASRERIDRRLPGPRASIAEEQEPWPPYRLDPGLPAVQILQKCAESALGHPVPLAVSRFSNIGNYLAAQGIPATCGLGVEYENVHAPDEAIELRSLLPTYEIYRRAVLGWTETLP